MDTHQFGLHILFIVAVVQFVLGALAAWLFGGGAAKSAAGASPESDELEKGRVKQKEDQRLLEDAMQQIFRLTGKIGHNVGEHSAEVKRINDELTEAAARGDDDVQSKLLAAISQMTEANEKLQGELKTAEARMAEQAQALESQMAMARTDALTGILNRRAFDDELERRVSEYQRYRTPVSLLLFDIDHFKKFNDTYGHQTGDDVLVNVACTLSMVMRDVDLVCRYGGEEFAIILPATDLVGAGLAAERARAAIERALVESSGQKLKVTASGGVSSIMPNEDVAGLIARADQGLYASKKAGRNCVYVHDGEQLSRNGEAAPSAPKADKAEKPVIESAHEETDALHLLPNRDAFAEEVRRRVEQHHRYHAPVTIVYSGVDEFAAIVARYGREAGNVILRAIAQFLKAVLRENEMLARVADDRFALVLGGLTASEAAAKFERIRHAVEKCKLPVDGLADVRFSASFGLAEIEPTDDAAALMNRGIAAFQAAARHGNQLQIESAISAAHAGPVAAGA